MKNKTLTKFLSVFLAVVMVLCSAPLSGFVGIDLPDLFSIKAEAYAIYTDGNFKYSVEDGKATLSGCVDPTGDIVIPPTLGGYPVTSIAYEAFRNCTNLTSVTIPDSVTSIGSSAFSGCDSLTSVTIGDSVTSIGRYAFSGCASLTTVTIGGSVTNIGEYTFLGCTSLARVYYTGDIESWCEITFDGVTANPMYYAKNFYIDSTLVNEIVISDTVTEIKDYAFYSFEGVTSVTIGDSVTSIGYEAFYGCTNLTSVTIPDSVTSIGTRAFENCTSLVSVTIPDSVTSIGTRAFENCTSLTSVAIPDGVTSIGYSAFSYCTSLTTVTIGGSVTNIGDSAFSYCTSLVSVTIPDSVTSIGDSAFSHCESLTSVTIGSSVTSIGRYAFNQCRYLDDVYYTGDVASWCNIKFLYDIDTLNSIIDVHPFYYGEKFYINGELVENLVIPGDTSVIKKNVFFDLECLKSVTIPKSVISIQKDAFFSCDGIEIVYYEGTEAEWEEIAIYEGNDCLINAKKVFLNGGHEHVYNSSVTTEPTCAETGVKTFKCSCGETYTESIPALGHTWGNWIVTLEPTSTTDGRKVRSCTACNNAVEEELIPKTGYGELYSVRIDNLTLVEGSTNSLKPSVSYYGDISYSVSYSSSDKSVAIVDAEGTVAALNAGTSIITCKVTASNGTIVSDTCTVTVTKKNADKPEPPDEPDIPDKPETKLSVSVSDLAMNYKSTAKLSPSITASGKYTVKYTSSDESVVTVDKDGNVTALGEGNAEITVTVTDANGNTAKDTCKVTVTVAWWQWIIKILLLGFLWY